MKKKELGKVNRVTNELELSEMTYNDIYDTVMNTIDTVDYTITNKIAYNMRYGYSNNVKPNAFRKITFSDCKVIYPELDSPGFYSYYLMKNPQQKGNEKNRNKTIEKLVNENIPIDKILDIKSCNKNNSCTYLGIDGLLIDTVYMLSFADLLMIEELDKGGELLVPIGYLFKYYKYLIKYLRLIVFKKYFSGTLKKSFHESAKRLWIFALTNLKRNTSQVSETDVINLEFKKILKNFHVALFHRRSLLRFYPELEEAINNYHNMIHYIQLSRSLFKTLDDSSTSRGKTIQSISIQQADKEISENKLIEDSKNNSLTKKLEKQIEKQIEKQSDNQVGGGSRIGLYDEYDYDDLELDNPISKSSNMLEKLDKLVKNEIIILGKLNK